MNDSATDAIRTDFRVQFVPVACVALLVDINQMSERTTAEREAEARGLPCMALSDPTVGAYPLTNELNLLAQADPQAVAYFHSAGVTVSPLANGISPVTIRNTVSVTAAKMKSVKQSISYTSFSCSWLGLLTEWDGLMVPVSGAWLLFFA